MQSNTRVKRPVRASLRRAGVATLPWVISAAVLASCSTSNPAPGGSTSSSAATAGKCRYVTATEMARATGLAAVKPVETVGGCSYLLDPSDSMPSQSATTGLPPSVDFYFYRDTVGISGAETDLSSPDVHHISDLGFPAGYRDDDGWYELVARVPNGAVRVIVAQPDPPQHLRTDDRTAIAVQILRAAQPRLL